MVWIVGLRSVLRRLVIITRQILAQVGTQQNERIAPVSHQAVLTESPDFVTRGISEKRPHNHISRTLSNSAWVGYSATLIYSTRVFLQSVRSVYSILPSGSLYLLSMLTVSETHITELKAHIKFSTWRRGRRLISR